MTIGTPATTDPPISIHTKDGKLTLLFVTDDIDLCNSHEIERTFSLGHHPEINWVTFDLSNVAFFDCSGIYALLRCLAKVEASTKVEIILSKRLPAIQLANRYLEQAHANLSIIDLSRAL